MLDDPRLKERLERRHAVGCGHMNLPTTESGATLLEHIHPVPGLLLPAVHARIEAIIREEGAFRVPKTWGYFVAEVSSCCV
jgi:hypothetical protein